MKNAPAFRITLIDNATLLHRLSSELRFLFHQLRLGWLALKRDPVGFGRQMALAAKSGLRRAARPTSVAALASALVLVLTAVVLIIWLGNEVKGADPADAAPGEQAQMITFLPNGDASREGEGVGVGSKGRVGFRVGKGQGSVLEVKRSTGGGSGGLHNPLPAQAGKPPQPSEIPAPIPAIASQFPITPVLFEFSATGPPLGSTLRSAYPYGLVSRRKLLCGNNTRSAHAYLYPVQLRSRFSQYLNPVQSFG